MLDTDLNPGPSDPSTSASPCKLPEPQTYCIPHPAELQALTLIGSQRLTEVTWKCSRAGLRDRLGKDINMGSTPPTYACSGLIRYVQGPSEVSLRGPWGRKSVPLKRKRGHQVACRAIVVHLVDGLSLPEGAGHVLSLGQHGPALTLLPTAALPPGDGHASLPAWVTAFS